MNTWKTITDKIWYLGSYPKITTERFLNLKMSGETFSVLKFDDRFYICFHEGEQKEFSAYFRSIENPGKVFFADYSHT